MKLVYPLLLFLISVTLLVIAFADYEQNKLNRILIEKIERLERATKILSVDQLKMKQYK